VLLLLLGGVMGYASTIHHVITCVTCVQGDGGLDIVVGRPNVQLLQGTASGSGLVGGKHVKG
jgi:hypothetical protein